MFFNYKIFQANRKILKILKETILCLSPKLNVYYIFAIFASSFFLLRSKMCRSNRSPFPLLSLPLYRVH